MNRTAAQPTSPTRRQTAADPEEGLEQEFVEEEDDLEELEQEGLEERDEEGLEEQLEQEGLEREQVWRAIAREGRIQRARHKHHHRHATVEIRGPYYGDDMMEHLPTIVVRLPIPSARPRERRPTCSTPRSRSRQAARQGRNRAGPSAGPDDPEPPALTPRRAAATSPGGQR